MSSSSSNYKRIKGSETLNAWQYRSKSFVNPVFKQSLWLYTKRVTVSFIDAGFKPGNTGLVAAIVVPRGREMDPLFNTEQGHHLLIRRYFGISRLFLVANKLPFKVRMERDPFLFSLTHIEPADKMSIEVSLTDMLLSSLPQIEGCNSIKFFTFTDGLISRVSRSRGHNDNFGYYAIVDEQVRVDEKVKFFRKLMFNTTPGLFGAEGTLLPDCGSHMDLDDPILTQDGTNVNLPNIVTDTFGKSILYVLSKLADSPDGKKILCFGASIAFLANCLANNFSFKVYCVEEDTTLLLNIEDQYHISWQSPLTIQSFSPWTLIEEVNSPGTNLDSKFVGLRSKNFVSTESDVLIIDLISYGDETEKSLIAPPREMITKKTVGMIKKLVSSRGAIMIHVIAPDYIFYTELAENLKEVFFKLYQIKLSNDNECLFIAVSAGLDDFEENELRKTLLSLAGQFCLEEVEQTWS